MNDFTKEELEDIVFALETVYMGNSVLRIKIQAMIDNYCEHESDGKECRVIISGVTHYQSKCKKCGEWYR